MIPDLQPRIDGNFYHFGVVVKDIDAAMDNYRTLLGVPSFQRLDTNYEARHRGWQGTIANRNAFGKCGDILVELVEPGRGHGPAQEALEARGEGVFHVGYSVDDPAQRPGGVEACFEVIQTRRPDGAFGIVYLDTIDRLGFFVELVETSMADMIIKMVDALPTDPFG